MTRMAAQWGLAGIPSVALVAVLLLGTDAATAESERPFRCRPNHLPLERYCLTIADRSP
jgi:predicted membrane chloride channel (bestrophin family)